MNKRKRHSVLCKFKEIDLSYPMLFKATSKEQIDFWAGVWNFYSQGQYFTLNKVHITVQTV